MIYDRIKCYVTSGIAKKVANLLDVMRMECCTEKLSLYQDRIHVANGTYYLNGTFSPQKDFCRNRLPVSYNPEAPQPVTWLHFFVSAFGARGHSDFTGIYGILLYSLHQRPEDASFDWQRWRGQKPHWYCPSCAAGQQHEHRQYRKGGDKPLRSCRCWSMSL